MTRFLIFFSLLSLSLQVYGENVYFCSGKATMCLRKENGLWRADVCNSNKYIFRFNEEFSELKYQKKIRDRNGKERNLQEELSCRMVEKVSPKKNNFLLSASNGRITCIDFDGSQLGIPEVLEEVIHFSKNIERFALYPMHSHSFLMNGKQTDFVTYGICKKSE